jgi:arylsulfatase A-like enzyme
MNKKNIIWIFGDQHRAQALSCNGDPNVSTPNIDLLSGEGVNCQQAVAGSPLCCPFRGSLLTSRYPHECVPGHEYPMDPKLPTVANVFAENNYETAYFGKWHVDGHHESEYRGAHHIIPKERRGGFDTWIGYENNNSPWDSWVHGHRKNGEDVELQRLPGYETDELTDMLIDFIKEKAETKNNFFAALSVQPPHDPYHAPADFMGNFNPAHLEMRPNVPDIPRVQERARKELAGAYAQIENLDWNVGRIREALVESGMEFDTIIIFFSDHGDFHGSHGQFRKTSPLEESIKIPFIISGPPTRYDHHCGINDSVVSSVDIAPTSLGLCGIDKPEWMRGFDYSGLYDKTRKMKEIPDSAYIQIVVPTGHGDSVEQAWRGVVTRDGWKYVAFENQNWLLFNLNEDPYELANLAHNIEFSEKRKELNQRLAKWIKETGDNFNLPKV